MVMYAPFTLRELRKAKQYDLLGFKVPHYINGSQLATHPPIIFQAISQGEIVKKVEPKGCELVYVNKY